MNNLLYRVCHWRPGVSRDLIAGESKDLSGMELWEWFEGFEITDSLSSWRWWCWSPSWFLPWYYFCYLLIKCLLSIIDQQVECQTEDGVRVDAVGHLALSLTAPDGTVISGSTVYRKPSQNRDGIVTYTPQTSKHLEHSGSWSVSCQFTEYRDRLKSILLPAKHVISSDEAFKFIVLPGKSI